MHFILFPFHDIHGVHGAEPAGGRAGPQWVAEAGGAETYEPREEYLCQHSCN